MSDIQADNQVTIKKPNFVINAIGQTNILSSKIFLLSLLHVKYKTDAYQNDMSQEDIEFYKELQKRTKADFSRGLVAEMPIRELVKEMGLSVSGKTYDMIYEHMLYSFTSQWNLLLNDEYGVGSTAIVTSSYFNRENSIVYIKFSEEEEIQKELIDAKNKFSLLQKDIMMAIRNDYAFRLYEILVSQIGLVNGRCKDRNLSTYKFEFGLAELKYKA